MTPRPTAVLLTSLGLAVAAALPAHSATAAALRPLPPVAPPTSAAVSPTPRTLTGTVQMVVRDQPRGPHRGGATDVDTVLRVGSRVVPLTAGSLPDAETGDRVTAEVVPAAGGTTRVLSARTLPAAATPPVSATQTVYLALVVPKGLRADPGVTAASATEMVRRASAYWSSQTGGKVRFAVARVLPTYASAYSCGETEMMWNEADQRMPESFGPDRHLLLVAPREADQAGCDYGLGTVGAVHATGGAVFVSDLNQSLFAHELGHNLGLLHSNSLRCARTPDVTVVHDVFPGCQQNSYDDMFDVMGYSGSSFGEGSLNAVHLDGMGLLPTAVRRIGATGVTTARIAPLSTTSAGRALRITDRTGVGYFVEYRTSSGLDRVAAANPAHPAWGVRVLRDDPAAPASAGSYELDATPTALSSWGDYNRVVPVGHSLVAASGSLTITVTSADAAGATIAVTDGAGPAPSVPSRVSISAPTRATFGSAVHAATTVTDQYGRPRAGWRVTLQKLQRGATAWKPVQTVRTGSTGRAQTTAFANGLSGRYRWVTAAAAGAPARYSAPVDLATTVPVYLSAPAAAVTRGSYLAVRGRNGYARVPSPVVHIEYRRAGARAWTRGPRVTVSTSSTSMAGRLRVSARGSYDIRLHLASGTAYTGAVSAARRTVVR